MQIEPGVDQPIYDLCGAVQDGGVHRAPTLTVRAALQVCSCCQQHLYHIQFPLETCKPQRRLALVVHDVNSGPWCKAICQDQCTIRIQSHTLQRKVTSHLSSKGYTIMLEKHLLLLMEPFFFSVDGNSPSAVCISTPNYGQCTIILLCTRVLRPVWRAHSPACSRCPTICAVTPSM